MQAELALCALLNRNPRGLGDVGGEHGMGWRLETSPPLGILRIWTPYTDWSVIYGRKRGLPKQRLSKLPRQPSESDWRNSAPRKALDSSGCNSTPLVLSAMASITTIVSVYGLCPLSACSSERLPLLPLPEWPELWRQPPCSSDTLRQMANQASPSDRPARNSSGPIWCSGHGHRRSPLGQTLPVLAHVGDC
jgi:hypothetical protein